MKLKTWMRRWLAVPSPIELESAKNQLAEAKQQLDFAHEAG